MVVLDTNIIIDELRLESNSKKSKLEQIVKKEELESLAVSVITIQELYQGQSTIELKKEMTLLNTIEPLTFLKYNYEIAELAGKIVRDTKQTIIFQDAAIAATAIYNKAKLYTLNKKDFKNINNLLLY